MDWPSMPSSRGEGGGDQRLQVTDDVSRSMRLPQSILSTALPKDASQHQSHQQQQQRQQEQQHLSSGSTATQQSPNYTLSGQQQQQQQQQQHHLSPAQTLHNPLGLSFPLSRESDRSWGQSSLPLDPIQGRPSFADHLHRRHAESNSNSLAEFVATLRVPYSYRSLSDRWQWLSAPQLETDLRPYPTPLIEAPVGARVSDVGFRTSPNLSTLSRFQEDAFEDLMAACLGGDTNAYNVKPVDYFAIHAILYCAAHAELLAREQGLDPQQRLHVRQSTLRGLVADLDSDRNACQPLQQHFALLRLMWGEALDLPVDVLWQHCSCLAQSSVFATSETSMSALVRGRTTSGSSTLPRLPMGLPAFPPTHSPTLYPPVQLGEGIPKRDSLLQSTSPSLSRGGPFGNFQLSDGLSGHHWQSLHAQHGLTGAATLDLDLGAHLRAQYSPQSLQSSLSQYSSSPSSFRSVSGGLERHTAEMIRRSHSLSPQSFRGAMTAPYNIPPATQTVLGRSLRRTMQSREKSKRHYIRKKLQRNLFAEVLHVFVDVLQMLRQIPAVDESSEQGIFGEQGSSVPSTLGETHFANAVARYLSESLRPPVELANLIPSASNLPPLQTLGQGVDISGIPGSTSPSWQSSADAQGSSTLPPTTTAAGIPIDLTISDATAAAGAAATNSAYTALHTNERKRISKLMQRHNEKQRMYQILSISRHVLRWLPQTGAHRLPPDVGGEPVFNHGRDGMGGSGSSGSEGHDSSSVAGGLNMAGLRAASTRLASQPEVAAHHAFIQAWRSFSLSWSDLIKAEARLGNLVQAEARESGLGQDEPRQMNESKRPISQLVDVLERRQSDASESRLQRLAPLQTPSGERVMNVAESDTSVTRDTSRSQERSEHGVSSELARSRMGEDWSSHSMGGIDASSSSLRNA